MMETALGLHLLYVVSIYTATEMRSIGLWEEVTWALASGQTAGFLVTLASCEL